MFGSRPLQGWGSGSFHKEYVRQRQASSARAVSASHTIPVTVAAEQGVIGLIPYIALLVAAFSRLLVGARRSVARAAIAACFAALVFHTMLYAAFLEDPITWALLAAGTALAFREVPA
jgi:O-antigen ligase